MSKVTIGNTGRLSFVTNHFSYFALVNIPPVVVTPPPSGGGGGGGGSSGGGSSGGGSSSGGGGGGGGTSVVPLPVVPPKIPTECTLTGSLSSCVVSSSGSTKQ